MAFNLTLWFAISLIIIIIFALISNSSAIGLSNINIQFFKMNCPLPITNAVATNLNTNPPRNFITYNVTYDNSTSDYHVTTFHCSDDNSSISASTTVYTTANNFFNIGISYLFYASQVIMNFVIKIQAFVTILSYVLTPINFNILGFTINDIGGQALMLVIGVYVFCYTGISIFLYRAILPSGGIT